jgi:HEAT repeat protein
MSVTNQLKGAGAAGVAVPAAAERGSAALKKLLAGVQAPDPHVRMEAWLAAGAVGAVAVQPLAKVVDEGEMEVSRAAKRGMWQIVRYVGRPGGDRREKDAVVNELLVVLNGTKSVPVRREVVRMLSEIGGDESVPAVSSLLSHADLREDARMTLERIPGEASLGALKSALNSAPKDFKANIAQSLRARGVEVKGFPCKKLVPTKQTNVKPLAGR